MEKYNLVRRRGMKNLRLRVKADGSVHVSAPYGVAKSTIDEFVESRTEWIAEQRKRLSESVPQAPAELSNGSVITLFGRKYTVTVREGDGGVFAEGNMLVVPSDNGGNIETAVLRFMAEQCRRICTEAVKFYLERAGYKGSAISLEFKYLKSRWGSYNRQKNLITLNLALCKLPEKYISYVAAHEVTHIFVHNHSDDFYKFGETIYDGFFRTDRELNKIRIGGLFS